MHFNHTRRYDVDWIRVIAIGLLLLYHIGIGFQPWGVFVQFIQNSDPLEYLWIPMSMLNVWRIPLLFFVSGMGTCFAMRKRNWKELIAERVRRILVPFIFGVLFIVPLHILIWQKYYMQDLAYTVHPVHLWFLGNIFIYVILLSPFFFYLKSNEENRFNKWLIKAIGSMGGLAVITGVFVLEAVLVKPDIFERYALTMHGFLLGMMAFLSGFFFVYCGKKLWSIVLVWRWAFLMTGFILFIIRFLLFDLKAPYYLFSLESSCWIYTVFGFGYKYLNYPGKILNYLSGAAYPVYIIHMITLYGSSYFIMPLNMVPLLKFILVMVITFSGSFIIYEFVIRRSRILRPLFGLKKRIRQDQGQ